MDAFPTPTNKVFPLISTFLKLLRQISGEATSTYLKNKVVSLSLKT